MLAWVLHEVAGAPKLVEHEDLGESQLEFLADPILAVDLGLNVHH